MERGDELWWWWYFTAWYMDSTLEELKDHACIWLIYKQQMQVESAVENFPSLVKVILMKRPARYDPVENNPLALKPQLSSLAD